MGLYGQWVLTKIVSCLPLCFLSLTESPVLGWVNVHPKSRLHFLAFLARRYGCVTKFKQWEIQIKSNVRNFWVFPVKERLEPGSHFSPPFHSHLDYGSWGGHPGSWDGRHKIQRLSNMMGDTWSSSWLWSHSTTRDYLLSLLCETEIKLYLVLVTAILCISGIALYSQPKPSVKKPNRKQKYTHLSLESWKSRREVILSNLRILPRLF